MSNPVDSAALPELNVAMNSSCPSMLSTSKEMMQELTAPAGAGLAEVIPRLHDGVILAIVGHLIRQF